MLVKLFEDIVAHGANVGAGEGGFEDMQRMTDGGGKNVGFESVIRIDGFDLANDVHADVAERVEATDERADISGATLGGEQRLDGGECDSDVGFDALSVQRFDCLQPFFDEGDFDDDIVVNGGEAAAFLDDFGRGEGNGFEAYGAF